MATCSARSRGIGHKEQNIDRPLTLGISGVRRNAAVALCRGGRIVAACEQERVTRARDVGTSAPGFPSEAVEMVLRIAGGSPDQLVACGIAEDGIDPPREWNTIQLPHHAAHAATAFLTSSFEEAVVVVCSHRAAPEMAVYRASADGIHDRRWAWEGVGFSRLYSMLTDALGFEPRKDEHHMEALARQGHADRLEDVRPLFGLERDRLWIDSRMAGRVAELRGPRTANPDPRTPNREPRTAIASALQRHLGDLLIEFLQTVRSTTGARNLCLSGGLFYNTYLTTRVRESGIFDEVFIPVHPGNAGLAVGCALMASPARERPTTGRPLSPFLGPQYTDTDIKAILDNCKLSYEYLDDGDLIRHAVAALRRGHLLGWFQGSMEWGPRALGCRSILANPLAPYVLENLNTFLKRRDPPRSYAVSVCEENLAASFEGPSPSPLMQFEHRVKDPALFSHIMSQADAPIRVHTVGDHPGLLRQLLKAFGQETGTPVLVNTSFNGFHEPIVCSPRDAVRVFYGSGLDMLVMGNFMLRK
jgi:carbamoyltransferase